MVLNNEGISFFKDFIYLFLEKRREGDNEGVKHQCIVASHALPTGDLAHNPDCALTWNRTGNSGSQSGTQLLSHTSQGQ